MSHSQPWSERVRVWGRARHCLCVSLQNKSSCSWKKANTSGKVLLLKSIFLLWHTHTHTHTTWFWMLIVQNLTKPLIVHILLLILYKLYMQTQHQRRHMDINMRTPSWRTNQSKVFLFQIHRNVKLRFKLSTYGWTLSDDWLIISWSELYWPHSPIFAWKRS